MAVPNISASLKLFLFQGITFISENGNELRKELIHSVRKLYFALETPMQTTIRTIWADRGLDLCIQIAVQLKLFEKMSETIPRGSIELADAASCGPAHLSRLLKHVAAMDTIIETSPEHHILTNFTKAFTVSYYRIALPAIPNAADLDWDALPAFLAENK